MALSFAAVLFAGLSRIFFLEHIPANGLSAEKLRSVQRASMVASLFTLIITISSGIYLGLQKLEHHKVGIKFRVYRYWHKAHVRRNKYTQQLIRDCHKMLLQIEQCATKYWELVLDLKEIFQTEYDAQNEKLNQEYVTLKAKPGFTLSDAVFLKYSPIAAAHEELFRHSVMNSPEIREKVMFINSILRIPEDHLAEHLAAVAKQAASQETAPASSVNGKLKDHQFITLK